jgi:hypothetical protein
MKKLGILLMLIVGIVSCSNDKDENNAPADYYGTWQLTVMNRNKNPAANSISVLEWQEAYILTPNGTFSKIRVKDGKTIKESGTFVMNKTLDQTQFELTYDTQNEIIGSCSSNLKENLYIINSVGKLFSTWGNCDGPLLTYERMIY